MTYKFSEIWETLESEFTFKFLKDDVDTVHDNVESIVKLANEDLRNQQCGPYSHNMVGLSLLAIEGKSSREVALRVMDLVPAIECIYKIQRPENEI